LQQQINYTISRDAALGSVRARAASGFLDRGAQAINRIIYPAAIGAHINYEVHIIPKHDTQLHAGARRID
jgi:hypothetical protein